MINEKNYFTLENKYISNSKISDFYKDKEYFYQKHVTGKIHKEPSDEMIIGKAVDKWLTEGRNAYEQYFLFVTRRDSKSPDYTRMLNPTMVKSVETICEKAVYNKAFQEIKNFKKQEILFKDMDLGLFKGICGIPDFYQVDGETATIVDLKTTESADPKKYYYKCLTYNYFRQMAMYDLLIRNKYPEVKNVVYRHLAIEKDGDGIYNAFTFNLSPTRVEVEKSFILDTALPAIAAEKEFLRQDASWDDAIMIGEVFDDM